LEIKTEKLVEYTVIMRESEEGGYWAEVPALPGCFSQGETIEQALANIKEAIELHIEGLKEEGQEIPKDSGSVVGRIHVPIFPKK
jgi:predicted RNase H-like HicB family nuclease